PLRPPRVRAQVPHARRGDRSPRTPQDRFLVAAERVAELSVTGLDGLFPAVDTGAVAAYDATLPKGLF
ncbi:2-methylcitrate dehydratase, partial [Streptomyces sp. Ncost-T6T-2b]